MDTTFIATVLNEENTVEQLLKSLKRQTVLPREIIISDGGSSDNTAEITRNYISIFRKLNVELKLIVKKGNRSVGRNIAIREAKGKIILCSDAGCILDENWVKEISKPFTNPDMDVVAGYYKGKAKTIFQRCLIPYVLIMEDRVNPNSFLPASRSLAFTKSIWEKVGGFPEKLSHNEDYFFARRLRSRGAVITFQKEAIVYWLPRNNIADTFNMFYRFAYGDAEAGLFRPKVLFIFVRYILFLLMLIAGLFLKEYLILNTLYLTLFMYIVWSILKNYRYVRDLRAFYYLPLLQLISDIAVLAGTTLGSIHKIWDTQKTQ
jgi:glycosyltransferase involved in cell wall biosynthesis